MTTMRALALDPEIKRAILQDLTVPLVPHAASALGLSRSGVYNAAKSGDLPIIQMGRRKVVPTAPLRRMLGIEAGQSAAAGD